MYIILSVKFLVGVYVTNFLMNEVLVLEFALATFLTEVCFT